MAKGVAAGWQAPAIWAAAFLAAALVVFHPVLGGRVLGGRTADAPYLERLPPGYRSLLDVGAVMHPFLRHTSAELRAGRVPLWNPFAGAGSPFLANQQSSVLHPFTWLAILLPWRVALTALAFLRLALAFVGTFALARDLGQPRGPALVAASSFATCGGIVVWVCYPVGSVLAHVPLLLFLARRAARHRAASPWLGAALASSILAGHFEYLPVIWAVTLAVAWGRGSMRSRAPLLGMLACAVASTALFLLPSVEYLRQSPIFFARAHRTVRLHDVGPLLCAIVDAGPFRLEPAPELRELKLHPQTVAGAYVGTLVLVLAAVGAAASPRLGAEALLLLLVLLPRPVGGVLWGLPVLSWMQPEKLWTLLALALSLLAGHGVAAVVEGRGRRPAAFTGLAAAVCLLGWEGTIYASAVPQRYRLLAPALAAVVLSVAPGLRRVATPLLLAILLIERVHGIGPFNPWERPARLFPEVPVLSRVAALQGNDRVVAIGGVLVPNVATVYQLRDTRLYDAISLLAHGRLLEEARAWTPFGLRRRAAAPLDRRAGATLQLRLPAPAYEQRLPDGEPTGATAELIPAGEACQIFWASDGALTSIRFHVRASSHGHDGLVVELRAPDRPSPLLFGQRLRPRWLPEEGWKELRIEPPLATGAGERMEIVLRSEGRNAASGLRLSTTELVRGPALKVGAASTGRRLAFGATWNEAFAEDMVDEGNGIVVVRDRHALPRARLRSAPHDTTGVRFLRDDAGEVVLRVEAPAADVLELGDTLYPGWRAEVDGAPAPIVPDGAFRAVAVPPGSHEVRMRYAPASYAHGLFVSAMTLLAAALVRGAWRRPRPAPGESLTPRAG